MKDYFIGISIILTILILLFLVGIIIYKKFFIIKKTEVKINKSEIKNNPKTNGDQNDKNIVSNIADRYKLGNS